MKYRRDSDVFFQSARRPRDYRSLWLVLLVVIVVVFGSIIFQGVDSPIMALTYPALRISGQIENNFKDVGSFLRGDRQLVSDLQKAKLEIARLNERNLVLEQHLKDYNKLTGLVASSTLQSLVPVRVLSRPGFSPYDVIVIGAGSKTNAIQVKGGDLIFSAGGIVLGRVDKVYGATSQVKLFSTSDQILDVEVGEKHVSAKAEGQGGGNFRIILPRGIEIKVGDTVIAPTISADLLGVVGEVKSEPENPFQTLYFKSPVNLYELVWVFIRR